MSKLVAVIGGGPTGFAAARALIGEQFRVRIYERQSQAGGVWVYTGHGPMYRDLDTNIFKELMEYRGQPFPSQLPRYVPRQDVLEYVQAYSHEIAEHRLADVYWNTEVTALSKQGDQWNLGLRETASGVETTETADFVLVASGHYNVPYFPPIPGLSDLAREEPHRVTHSRFYDNPEPFRNKRVLVIGNGSSGVDITIQLLSVTAPLTVSRHKPASSDATFEEGTDVVWKPEATSVSRQGEVTFSDGSRAEFDVILVATGYLYTLPFLEPEKGGKAGKDVVDEKGLRVRNLHKFMFYIEDPTLAFVGLNKQVVPMPFTESQGAVIARVWSGRLDLPSVEEMQAEERRLIAEKGEGSAYLSMGYPVDVEYMHTLNDWADSAGPGGFKAERWGPEKEEMRSKIAEEKLGEYKRKRNEAVSERERAGNPAEN